ncbi:putative bifunctional diguanylate cyclase/phosphodiesterase [Streptomyces odontomachi]|uniref:putative bifunctional diguanylate cyclase/phosphodiesterase n=1 Tax=Streptomyces odontomachi TaxID=2944940 RepID=UPI0027E28EB6|nr:bifunctional diguanylate cyclase/phosphodiesterase [Streptomyces sp. ODS25]
MAPPPADPPTAHPGPAHRPAGNQPSAARPSPDRTGATGPRSGASCAHWAAFAAAPVALAVVDGAGLVATANSAFTDLFGTGGGAPVGRPAADLVDLTSDSRIWHAYREVLRGRSGRLRCTRRLKHPDGHSLWAQITIAPLTGRQDSGKDSGDDPARKPAKGPEGTAGSAAPAALLSVSDITARRELQARLRHLEMHDPVTRLPNRTLFFERLTAALEAGSYDAYEPPAPHAPGTSPAPTSRPAPACGQRPSPSSPPFHPLFNACGRHREAGTGRVGLCVLGLDGFKAVNDTLGHRIGDLLLAAVADRLTHCAEQAGLGRAATTPLVARLGGDEFALLVEDSTGTEQVADLAESVLRSLQKPFDLSGQRLSVSASIGVVERRAAGTTATALMQAADTTLYYAKADGKGRWTLFDPERNAHRMTRQALSSTLRPAVERGEFMLEYQPLVRLEDGGLRGVEALVRWQHPQFGTLTPNRFIGLAEEDGSIVQLGRWILQTACRQARQWQIDHPDVPPVYVSVNVAVRQVWDSDLVADVAEILAETGLAPRLLQLELTESAVMGSAGRPLQALQALSDMGVRIAIDDFGTGYSNLAYLSRLPVSVLKLDGSFVRGFRFDDEAHPNPADEVIVEALVQLAHRLGLTVTAECVETSGQADRLRRIGCDTAQGWLYSRAVRAERIPELLVTGACPRA